MIKFTTELFDESLFISLPLSAFPFYINRMCFFDSSIPSKIFYDLISSEILPIARKNTDLINLITWLNDLLIRMKKPGKWMYLYHCIIYYWKRSLKQYCTLEKACNLIFSTETLSKVWLKKIPQVKMTSR